MPKCSKCGGTGLIPFKNRRDAWIDCECKQQAEHYQPVTPADFDFPMSDTFRAFSFEYCNQPDPGTVPPEPITLPLNKQQAPLRFQELQGQVTYLQDKLLQHLTPKPKQTQEGYKGIK